jgi:hypothetical protein
MIRTPLAPILGADHQLTTDRRAPHRHICLKRVPISRSRINHIAKDQTAWSKRAESQVYVSELSATGS